MVAISSPIEIFCSYAHEDESWLRKLETHLSLLKREDLISLWHDRLIVPGADWTKSIDTHLETASVILLLVSADFLASDYCYGIEMKRALERHVASEARVVPILVRPVDWKGAPFARLQALPTDARPISSWLDDDRALADVAAGIRRVIEDLPLLAASAPRTNLPAIWNVPYQPNPFFLGRDEELAQLRSRLQAGRATAISQPQAISGLGGIGKTQLALEYAYRYHQDYQAVLWAGADNADALIASYIAIATLLRLPEREAKEQDMIVQAVKTWLQTHRSWLLILDNADELKLLPAFLPPSPSGHVLLTTRAAATGPLAHRMEIETLLPERGALFLLRRAALLAPDAPLEQASHEKRELALQVSQGLGGLPLALDQAGAYLEETGTDLSSYWQIYQQYRADLLRERRGLGANHPAPVATTWSLSFERVEEKNPAAADLLRLCAFLAPDAIPEEIITEGAIALGPNLQAVAQNPLAFNQAIGVLLSYSLLKRQPAERLLSIHRLVQAVILDELDKETQQATLLARLVTVLTKQFPEVDHPNWEACERLVSHIQAVAAQLEQQSTAQVEAAALFGQAGQYLQERGRYEQAEPLYQRALAIREQQLGPDHPDTASSLNNLAFLYFEQGKYAEAEPLYQRELHIREQQLGPDHPDLFGSLNGLAELYSTQGNYTEAEPLYQRVLHILEQQLDPEDHRVASSLHGLASLYSTQGKYEQAEPLYQRALAIREQFGPDHPDTASSLNNLAWLYQQQGKYAEAELLYQRALHIREQQKHPDVASSLHGLASLYYRQGKYAEAEPLYQRALHIREQQLGPDHPDVASSLQGLANLYSTQGKYEQAEPLYQRALAIYERVLRPEHPYIAATLSDLASLYREQGKSGEAEPLLERALTIREKVSGTDHLHTATALNHLAFLYWEQGKYEQAEPLLERALAIHEKALGSEHPEVANDLNNLADLSREQGKSGEAEPLYQRALHIWEQQLGAEQLNVAYPLSGLASLYYQQDKFAEAEQFFQRALRIREASAPQDPETAETMYGLAQLQEALGNSEEARTFYARALAVREQALGVQHPKTTETRARLIALLHALGQHEEAAQLEEAQPES